MFFKETDFQMITLSIYEKLIQNEVYKKCALNDSSNYHILKNFAFDLTHDIWLGVIQCELSLVLTSLINQKSFSLEFSNDRIKGFNYGPIDIENRPNLLNIPD